MYVDLTWQELRLQENYETDETDEEGKPIMDQRDSGVVMQARPLDYEPYQQVMTLLTEGLSKEDLQDEKKVAAAFNSFSNPKLQGLVKGIFPEHLKELTGITIKEIHGERPAKVKDLYTYGHFLIISVQILTHLFSISSIGEKVEPIKKQLPELSEEEHQPPMT